VADSKSWVKPSYFDGQVFVVSGQQLFNERGEESHSRAEVEQFLD
jgi:hypothetical protein